MKIRTAYLRPGILEAMRSMLKPAGTIGGLQCFTHPDAPPDELLILAPLPATVPTDFVLNLLS